MRDLGREESEMAPCKFTRRALNALLRGPHAHLGGRTPAARARKLSQIACAFTRHELAAQRGVGVATVTEIELWLKAQGLSLRSSDEA
jgi:hypothetical protein